MNKEILENHNPLESIFDFETFKVKTDCLSDRQKRFAHFIDPRFFEEGVNPFRACKKAADYIYETPVELEEELFYLHPLMDPMALEQGNVRRFPAGVNEKYIAEKYFEDKWVSEGNNELSKKLEEYLLENIDYFREKESISLLDIGPCGGAITTLFALRAFYRVGLINKVKARLLDIVPNVLEATYNGRFGIPQEMIDEYELDFAGANGEIYKNFLHSERAAYYRGDGESLPAEIGECDIVLSAYTHHHLNMLGRRELCNQMTQAAAEGGFIGVADFYVPTYEDYMEWYKPHFEKYGDAPPVECPLVDGETLAGYFEGTEMTRPKELKRSFVISGKKI